MCVEKFLGAALCQHSPLLAQQSAALILKASLCVCGSCMCVCVCCSLVNSIQRKYFPHLLDLKVYEYSFLASICACVHYNLVIIVRALLVCV